jgi:hypothetical protein
MLCPAIMAALRSTCGRWSRLKHAHTLTYTHTHSTHPPSREGGVVLHVSTVVLGSSSSARSTVRLTTLFAVVLADRAVRVVHCPNVLGPTGRHQERGTPPQLCVERTVVEWWSLWLAAVSLLLSAQTTGRPGLGGVLLSCYTTTALTPSPANTPHTNHRCSVLYKRTHTHSSGHAE